jgi:hypothetical protein
MIDDPIEPLRRDDGTPTISAYVIAYNEAAESSFYKHAKAYTTRIDDSPPHTPPLRRTD